MREHFTMCARAASEPPAAGATTAPLLEADRALLDAFRRGGREALGQVYFCYVDSVATLLRFGFMLDTHSLRVPGARDPDDERDLVQEVFVRAFAERARRSYDGVRPYRHYLLRIAKNLLIDRQRARGHEVALDAGALDGDEPDPESEYEREPDVHWQRLAAATSDYVAGLSPELRELVRLRFEDGHSQADVAERMQLSRRRVRTLEHRAMTGLRRHLKRLKLLE
jgi:RNA polymerase sigma-70 factor (ECF subfamily)